jgi:hypothetical protein
MEFDQLNERLNNEFTNKLYKNKHIFYEIYQACGYRFMNTCGSYLFEGKHYTYCEEMYQKQELLYNAVKNATSVLEIGVYMGHSLLIMLLSNPNLKITCIDIDDTYAKPAVAVLNKYFPNAINLIIGDSHAVLSTLKPQFDFFHVDGNHEDKYIQFEFLMVQSLNSHPNNVLRIIFDDLQFMPNLFQKIMNHYKVITLVIPKCIWCNVFLEIQL